MITMVKQWIVTLVAVGISFTTVAEAQKAPGENASKVPMFTFATDSKEQEKQLTGQ